MRPGGAGTAPPPAATEAATGEATGTVVGRAKVVVPSRSQDTDLNEKALMIAAIVIGSIGLLATASATVLYFRKVATARVVSRPAPAPAAPTPVHAGEVRLAVVRPPPATQKVPPKSEIEHGSSSAQP